MAGRKKTETQRINLYLTVEAVQLLNRLTTENKRGRLVSELILKAAQDAGLVAGVAPPPPVDLAGLQQELRDAQRRLDDLQARVYAALRQYEEVGSRPGSLSIQAE